MVDPHLLEPDVDGQAATASPTAYERRIEVRPEPGALVAELEDCHHHFRLYLAHDGTVVERAVAEDVRAPWATCGQGAGGVAALEGLALEDAVGGAWARPRWRQCVHVVDLARIALAHTADRDPLCYRVAVTPPSGASQEALLLRNGEKALRWQLEDGVIAGPSPWTGAQVRGGDVLAVARRSGDRRLLEEAFVLRRGCHMAVSVLIDLDGFPKAADIKDADGSCWTYHDAVALDAPRRRGTSRPLGLSV
jgi:hypothetical protein